MLLHPSVPVQVAPHLATMGVEPMLTLDRPSRDESVWLEHVGRHSPIPDPPTPRCAHLIVQWRAFDWLVETLTPLQSLHVAVVGGGSLATTIGIALAHAGVGRLSFRDYVPTHPLDSWAYAPTTPRELSAAHAAAWTVSRHSGSSIVHPARPANLTVVTGYLVPDRATMLDLMAADAVHAYALAGHREVTVGPWVVPGSGPCWWCLMGQRVESDPHWDVASRRAHVTERPWCDPPLAWGAAAQLLRWCTQWAAGEDVTGQVVRVTKDGSQDRQVSQRPHCGCGGPRSEESRPRTG